VPYLNFNCWPGHGADDLDTDGPAEDEAGPIGTLVACQAACESAPECEGVVVAREGGQCYRKMALRVEQCANDYDRATTDMYAISRGLPPSPPKLPPPPRAPAAMTAVRAMFDGWWDDPTDRFWSMWGGAYEHRFPGTEACWDWDGDPHFWENTLEGTSCERNWLAGAVGSMNDRPFYPDSPALLGFDESINEFCAGQIGVDPWDGFDLNLAIAMRCRDARRNVLRDLQGAWSMCVNLQWQLCAVNGKLPGQGLPQISFATAPKDLQPQWWTDPGNNPIFGKWIAFGCCDPMRFSVADVYYAELFVAYKVCANGAEIFNLEVGELFTCDLDGGRPYRALVEKFKAS